MKKLEWKKQQYRLSYRAGAAFGAFYEISGFSDRTYYTVKLIESAESSHWKAAHIIETRVPTLEEAGEIAQKDFEERVKKLL